MAQLNELEATRIGRNPQQDQEMVPWFTEHMGSHLQSYSTEAGIWQYIGNCEWCVHVASCFELARYRSSCIAMEKHPIFDAILDLPQNRILATEHSRRA